jgi:hypothetical protein
MFNEMEKCGGGEIVSVAVSCSENKVKVILRPTVSRPVRLGVRHPSGTRDQFYLSP